MAFQIAEVSPIIGGDKVVGPWTDVVREDEFLRWLDREGIAGGSMHRASELDPEFDLAAYAWEWRPEEKGQAPRLFLSKPLFEAAQAA